MASLVTTSKAPNLTKSFIEIWSRADTGKGKLGRTEYHKKIYLMKSDGFGE